MQKINVIDKFDENELFVIQKMLFFCEHLDEIKDLGENINVTRVEGQTPFTFGIDNGKVLKYMTIGTLGNYYLVTFQEGKNVINYTLDANKGQIINKENYNNYEVDELFENDINDYNEGDYDGKER